MSSTLQELYGRRGRVVTDQDAREIGRVEELAYELKIRDVMSRDVVTAAVEMGMRDVLSILREKRISGLPVMAGAAVVGVVSIEDVVRAMSENNIDASVRAYMSSPATTANDYESIVKALETFTRIGVGRLPVVDESQQLVGMVTKGDITRGILLALQKDYHDEELRRYRASHLFEDITSDRTSLILRYRIKPRDFDSGGQASSHIKRALLRLGAPPQLARQCGIAVYEAEINLIIHSTNGGVLRVQIEPHRILMQTTDDGPGIDDVSQAMQPGWSTASPEARAMGFGAGMGLANIQRCVDMMSIDSGPGRGTKLLMEIILRPDEKFKGSESHPAEPLV